MSFVHLHLHSNYSLLWGANFIEDLVKGVKGMGMKAMALTDINNLYGLHHYLLTANEEGVIPIIGAEINPSFSSPSSRKRKGYKGNSLKGNGISGSVVCLVKDRIGYSNLCKLISATCEEKDFSLFSHLPLYSEGLVILCDKEELIAGWKDKVEDLYVELRERPGPLVRRAREWGLPIVATNDVAFLTPTGFYVHRLLRAIDKNTTISRLEEKELAPPSAYLKSPEEMKRAFSLYPEAIENTLRIAEKCQFRGDFHRLLFPFYQQLIRGMEDEEIVVEMHGTEASFEEFKKRTAKAQSDNFNPDEVLRRKAYEGAIARYGKISEAVKKRLDYELELIASKGFSTYFLVVEDIVKRSPRTCGRGSAAASVVSYVLGITNVDPIRYNLFFERFLNPGRVDPPDIDIDFAWDERDEVLEYVFKKYGTSHSAMISTHLHFRPRMAVREVAKVYGIPEAEINKVTKRIPWFWEQDEHNLLRALRNLPNLKDFSFNHPWQEIIRWAGRIIGFPRHISVHCGGVVITPRPIREVVPVEPAPKGVNVIQWEKDGAEDFGLIKIDLLGNRSLAVIRDAVQMIKENYGVIVDKPGWNPQDDPATIELLAKGESIGVFYVESPAMRQLQRKTGRGDFEHMVIHSSIIRPAANPYIREYVRRLKGGQYQPLHPLLEEVLQETYGIMVYQEDVAKVAVKLAEFSHADADALRKVLSKKHRHKKLEDFKRQFYEGAKRKGVGIDTIDKIWAMIESFSGYSFCKPHSASYAQVSFQSAYLKAHYPAEFLAAVISNQGGYYSTFAYISEAKRMGIAILPPDINQSQKKFWGKNREIRVGFMQVKGLRQESIELILEERGKRGYFRELEDFIRRTDIDPSDIEKLIVIGAFDSLAKGRTRPELLWILYSMENSLNKKTSPSSWLFTEQELYHPRLEMYGELEMLRREYELLGFLVHKHPLSLFKEQLKGINYVQCRDLARFIGRRVTTIGWLVTAKLVSTKNGEAMEFISFEDTTGIYETTFFPQAYRQFCHILQYNWPYVLEGKVEEDFGAISLTVERARMLKPSSRIKVS